MTMYRKSTPTEVKGYAKHYAEKGDYIKAINYYEEIGETGEISGLLGKFEKEEPVDFRAYKMRTANDVDGLIKAIQYFDDESLLVVRAAARELGKLGDKRAVGPLISVLENNKLAPVCRSESATALGKLGDNQAVEPLTKILTSPEKEHEINPPEHDSNDYSDRTYYEEGGPWHNMLYKGIRSFRSQVAQALGELGNKETVELLLGMLEPRFESLPYSRVVVEDNAVREGVALALGKLGKRSVEGSELAVDPLLDVLLDDSDDSFEASELRSAVHDALTSFGEAIAPQLILFLKQKQITVPQDVDSDWPILTTIPPAAIGAEFERQEMYDEADKWYNSQGMLKEAADARRKKADMSASKTEIHGDYVDDRDTIIKDSVLNRSNVGSGGSSKMQELKELKELFDSEFISKEEMEDMKKEILGK